MSPTEPSREVPQPQVPKDVAEPPVADPRGSVYQGLLEQSIAATTPPLAEKSAQGPIGFSPGEISNLINREVVSQHAEEAAFLWLLRDAAVRAPHYSLNDLSELDERVEAHLAGLTVAGDYGWELCAEPLACCDAGEVFAAAAVAIQSGRSDRLEQVLGVSAVDCDLERGLISALGWMPFSQIEPTLSRFIVSPSAWRRRIGVAGFAAHRLDVGSELIRLVCDDDSGVRARALRTAGELGRIDLLPLVIGATTDADETSRFAATSAAILLGDRSEVVMASLHQLADTNGLHREAAVSLAMASLPIPSATAWIREMWQNSSRLRTAATAIGALGVPELVPSLIEMMETAEIARVAGESFSRITGIDLTYDDLDRERPHAFATEPSEEEDDVSVDQDEDLAWPDPALVAHRWRTIEDAFQQGCRFLCGRHIDSGSLPAVLRHGLQRQRAGAAIELAMLEPTSLLFEVRAPTRCQKRSLQTWTS